MTALWVIGASALAGTLDGEVALDTLHASSSATEPGNGPEESLSATELGIRVRGEVTEVDDRLVIGVDYRAREPIAGTFPNSSLQMGYRAEVGWRTSEAEVWVGRFVAPALIWLPMDGVRGTLKLSESWATVYGGRRGIDSSRRPVPLDAFLPVAGVSVGRATEDYRGEVIGTLSGDRTHLGTTTGEVTEDVLGVSGLVRLSISAAEPVSFGGQLSGSQGTTYVVGSAPGQLEVTLDALSLYDAFVWTSWRPSRGARVDADVLHQRAELVRVDNPLDIALVDPSFSDVRLRGAFGMPTHLWVRPDLRVRLREARTEVRAGGGVEAFDLGITGPFVRGKLWVEDIQGDTPDNVGSVDRLLWQAGAGWEQGPIQIEAGASFVDRAAGPVSGRRFDPANPGQPVTSDDLHPFTLEAQNTGYLRGFVVGRRWFGGVDLETLPSEGEIRAFLQVGALAEAQW